MNRDKMTDRRIASDRGREPAEAHFRRLMPAPGGRSAKGLAVTSDRNADMTGCTFEVYRADEVSMTSTQFSGGDWHWRLADGEGVILLDTGGYASEGECLSAIAILQENAGFASVARNG